MREWGPSFCLGRQRREPRLAFAFFAVAALISACVPKEDSENRANTLIFLRSYGPTSLDPAISSGLDVSLIHKQVYERLMVLDPGAPGAVSGGLAKLWRLAPDGMSIAFELHPGHRFADGTQVNAAAVAFSLKRVKSLGKGSAGVLEWLRDVEVVDQLKLRILLHRPYSPALQMLAQSAASVVNPVQVRKHARGDDQGSGWLDEHSAGSGAYQVVRYNVGENLTLGRNDFAAPPRQFTTVRYRFLADEGVRRLLLERGDADVSDAVSAAFVERYRAVPGVSVAQVPGGTSLSFLTMNTRKGVMRDVRMRQAVAAAIDYRVLRDNVLKGGAAQLAGYLTPGTPGFDPREQRPSKDLAKARRLLREAGYDGRPLKLLMVQLGPVSEFLQSNLRQAGINVELQRMGIGAMSEAKQSGQFDLIYDAWYLDTPEATSMFDLMFSYKGIASGLNPSGYSNTAVDRLIAAALRETEIDRRAQLLRGIDAQLRIDRPIVMIFAADPAIAYRSDLIGLTLNPLDPFNFSIAKLSRKSP